jgi:argininosuccinate synthase
MVYDGLWFSGLHRELSAYIQINQEKVNGTVRVKLYKGKCVVVGRKSSESLYREELATYGEQDTFDHNAALGFIKLHGLSQQTQAQLQLGASGPGPILPEPNPEGTS